MKSSFSPAFSLHNNIINLYPSFTFFHELDEMKDCIHFLSQINCFVGVNNSGKSRLIRAMFQATIPIENNRSNTKFNMFSTSKPLVNEGKFGNNILTNPNNLALLKLRGSKDLQVLSFIQHLDDLLDVKFYVFENYNKIYTYLDELRNIINYNKDLEKWSMIILEQLNYSPLIDIITFIKSSKTLLSTLGKEYEKLENAKYDYVPYPIHTFKTLFEKYYYIDSIDIEKVSSIDEYNLLTSNLNTLSLEIEKLKNKKSGLNLRLRQNPIQSLEKKISDLEIRKSQIETEHIRINSINQQIESIKINIANLKDCESEIQDMNEQIQEKYKNWITLQESFLKKEITKYKQKYSEYISSKIKSELQELKEFIFSSLKNSNLNLPRLYIPILRGTRPLVEGKHDFYADRTFKDYNIKPSEVFTGLTLYKEIQNHLLGKHEKRILIKEYEDFLSDSFFNGEAISLIPNIDSDVVHIRIGESEHPIYELGDGIQALIILTFPLFIRKNENWAIFIEEPESHLHPKWQRFFFDTITKYFHKHQFFITTHSNIFISYPNISNYRVCQNDKMTIIQFVPTKENILLNDLGYKSSDLLNANYIIWVEGPSDKIYIQKFIEVFDERLREGIDYSIMFYGGCDNLTDYISIDRKEYFKDRINILSINPNCGFILDSDLKENESLSINQKEKQSFQEKSKQENLFCWITKCRELENFIPEDTWKKAAIIYATKINSKYGELTTDKVEFSEERTKFDYQFIDLTHKTKGTSVYLDKKKDIKININNKIMMAQAVTSIFPQKQSELEAIPELYNKLKELVEKITKANQTNL